MRTIRQTECWSRQKGVRHLFFAVSPPVISIQRKNSADRMLYTVCRIPFMSFESIASRRRRLTDPACSHKLYELHRTSSHCEGSLTWPSRASRRAGSFSHNVAKQLPRWRKNADSNSYSAALVIPSRTATRSPRRRFPFAVRRHRAKTSVNLFRILPFSRLDRGENSHGRMEKLKESCNYLG